MRETALSRRGVLLLASAAWVRASDSDFWNKKPPADWTPEEIERLLKDSPWAKEVSPIYTSPPKATDRGVWSENPPTGGGSLPPSPIPGGPGRPRPFKAPFHVTVRWESAEPIRSAERTMLPAAFRDRHVLGVFFQIAKDLGSRPIEDLKHSAVLVGGRPVRAEIVQAYAGMTNGFLIGFPKTAEAGAGQIEFSARVGLLALKAKFDTRDMRYHRQLAL